MDREGFVKLAVLAFSLVVCSFFIRGFGQLVVGRELATTLQQPVATIGFVLVVALFVRATLDWLGLWTIEPADE